MPEFPSVEQFIRELRLDSGAYAEYALRARRQYIVLRQRQDPEIRKLMIRAADRIAREIRNSDGMNIAHLVQIEGSLREEADRIHDDLSTMMQGYIETAVGAGVEYSRAVAFSYLTRTGLTTQPMEITFSRINRQAIEACYARTHSDGLILSDRVWNTSNGVTNILRDIIQEAVAVGMDAVRLAKMIQKYVRDGRGSLTGDYPNMMKRMGGRIPDNLSYDALRLARTEMTAAFGEGTILSSRATPSYKGMKWRLSSSHPKIDICDQLAGADFGLGRGVYPKGSEPRYPAHPNCLCTLGPQHEEPDDMVDRLLEWQDNPSSHPDIEEWYTTYYRAA